MKRSGDASPIATISVVNADASVRARASLAREQRGTGPWQADRRLLATTDADLVGPAVSLTEAIFLGLRMQKLTMNAKPTGGLGAVSFGFS